MKKLICVIPALEKNDYSNHGDLLKWGVQPFLSGKFLRLKVKKLEKIVVTTPSRKIKLILKNYNVDVLLENLTYL